MIKANELRKGNIVQYGIEEELFFRVETMSERGINGKFHEDEDMMSEGGDRGLTFEELSFEEIQPVLLSPDILEKCGFTKSDDENVMRLTRPIEIEIDFELKKLYLFAGMDPIYHIKHLHQLQNLYYALTGEELPVTL